MEGSEGGGEPFVGFGQEVPGAAAGAPGGVAAPVEARWGGAGEAGCFGEEFVPVARGEADEADELFALGVGEDDGGDGIDAESPGGLEEAIVEDGAGEFTGAEGLEVGGRLLGDEPEFELAALGAAGSGDDGQGEAAGGAFAPPEDEEGVAPGGEAAGCAFAVGEDERWQRHGRLLEAGVSGGSGGRR